MESRKRKRLLIAIVAIGLAAFVFWFFLLRNTEPIYDGKPLSKWIDIAAPWKPTPYNADERADATEAIRAIGTNGLPQLVDWVGYTPRGLRPMILRHYPNLPTWLVQKQRVVRFFYKPIIRADGAVTAFKTLGHDAVPAIHNLTRLVQSTNNSPGTRQRALSALAYIGPRAVPAILGVVSNVTQKSDLWVLPGISRMGANIDQVIPALLPQLQNTNLVVAQTILRFLRDESIEPELLVPAFTKCLADPRPPLREEASKAFASWGRHGLKALPALRNALNDTDAIVRTNAAGAIQQIDPSPRPGPPFRE